MYLERRLGRLADAVTGRTWESGEVRRQILRRASYYQRRGVTRGERVLLQLGNCPEFFADLLSVWLLGAQAVPVDARSTAFELGKLVEAAEARFTIVDDSTESQSAVGDGMTAMNAREAPSGDHGSLFLDGSLSMDDEALILFTSGSTGEPKGVVHTHRSLWARWATLQAVLGVAAFERTLCMLPTNFGHGLICNCLFPWLAGCDLFIAPAFRTDVVMRLGRLLDAHRITFMSSVPALWNLALRVSPPPAGGTLRRIHVGSAPLSAALWRKVMDWSQAPEVHNAYGITETGSWTAGTTGRIEIPEDGLIGTPWGATLRICRARTPGELAEAEECGANDEGTIWLSTPALMKGYFRRDDLTAAAVSRGWLMTGDIGVRDDAGRVFLRGRERDEINKGGMKVFPADVDAIAQDVEGVSDVCAFGIEDSVYGENVALAVVLERASPTNIRALYERLSAHLAAHKRPVRWYLLEEIPRSSRGKIDRRKVRDLCAPRAPLDLSDMLKQGNGKKAIS